MKNRRFNRRGFTLVEVLLALMILGIVFVPVSNAFLMSVTINQKLQEQVLRVRAAQSALESSLAVLSEVDGEAFGERPEAEGEAEQESEARLALDRLELEIGSFLTETLREGSAQPEMQVHLSLLPVSILTDREAPWIQIRAVALSSGAEDFDAPGNRSQTLTAYRSPGEAPWLRSREIRVMVP